jgi:hypothetical protein
MGLCDWCTRTERPAREHRDDSARDIRSGMPEVILKFVV